MANTCWYVGVVVVMTVRGGGCNHLGEAWLRPILTVRFRVEREGSPNKFSPVHIMPMMKVGRIFCVGDDELEVLRDVSLVCLKYPASFFGMIAPRGEKLCENLAVMIADNFSYKDNSAL